MSATIMPDKRQAATLRDVAENAGVSQMTVSRVLNTPELVRDATREKVRAAIETLGYKPNLMARSLAGGRSLFLGLIYNNASGGYLSELLLGALRGCRKGGHHLVVEEMSEAEATSPALAVARAREGGLDGVILAPPLSDNPMIAIALRDAGIPVSLITPSFDEGFGSVAIDDTHAASVMTDFIIDQGHTRIGFVRGKDVQASTDAREKGYRASLAKAGIAVDADLIVPGDYTFVAGMAAGEALFAIEDRPTAVFASNDDMAAGVMAAALRAGLRVPSDVSVAGFDDTELARTIWPRLTTMHQPIADMAGRAVDMLSDVGKTATPSRVVLDVELIERGSVVPPRDGGSASD